jgi:hypothetical protein
MRLKETSIPPALAATASACWSTACSSVASTCAVAESAIGTPGLQVLVATFVAVGAIFGTLDVAMVAFTGQVGAPAAAGPLLTLVAAGSLLAGLAYGARSWRWPLDKRFVASVVVLWGGTFPLTLAPSVALMAPASILAGVAIAPTLIAGFPWFRSWCLQVRSRRG